MLLVESVAGGLPAGHTSTQGLIKQCEEEAGWPERLIKKLCQVSSKMPDQQRNPNGRTIRSAGIVTYFEIKEQHILPNAE